jgi:hypothetical protein
VAPVINALEIVNRPLQRQLRGLSVALRAGSTERARRHARHAVALVNEATDLSLTADDLLLTLADGARSRCGGAEVVERLLEVGVQRRLEARGSLVVEGGERRFTREEDDLRAEIRALLGVGGESELDSDPRWAELLGGV